MWLTPYQVCHCCSITLLTSKYCISHLTESLFFKFTHSHTHLLVASALIIVKTSRLQPIRVFPVSRPDCRCNTKRPHTRINTKSHTQSAANCEAFSLTFNTTPASRAALLMPPAESVDPVSSLSSVSTEQRCDVVIYTQASANAHSCRLAGCKTTKIGRAHV